MKKTVVLCLILMCLFSAIAEEGMPPNAQILSEQQLGSLRVIMLECASGEQLQFTVDDRTGEALSLTTILPAPPATDEPQQRERAEAAVLEEYPDARVFSAEDAGNAKRLLLFGPDYCGSVTVQGGVVSRELIFGQMLSEDYLSMEGVISVLSLLRPQAEFRALELDEDDGHLVYEGEARIGGTEYEFEIDARTGKLYEWERD